MAYDEDSSSGRVAAGDYDMQWPLCQKCNEGVLLPLSDYGREGATVTYKAWVCINPDCGYHLRIDNGEVSQGQHVAESTR
ncbi:MAG: hypothetical protein QGH20_04305 [Candidatus Latescibacteria bacterium]|nr:hypothetical protein [Candidatus Latescibacterota bacterium]